MPRANLSREVVLAEAATLADSIGFERLTMTAIAERFGVAVPSLYKHVASLAAVQRDLALPTLRDLTEELEAAARIGQGRREKLRELGLAYRRFVHAHPGRYAAITHAPDPSDASFVSASETLLAAVYGVLALYQGSTMHDARVVRAALHGFVSLEASGGFGTPVDVEQSFRRMIDLLDVAFGGEKPEPIPWPLA